VRGNFDDCLRVSRELADKFPVALVNSVNPYRIEGQKTAAFEVVDFLGEAPDVHVLPVGNAGNISAYWKGYVEYAAAGMSTRRPRMLGWQAAGAAPLVAGAVVRDPETVASAIRIGNPASWAGAVTAKAESGGDFLAVSDAEILEAYHVLASEEGLFCEPASAASAAGFARLVDEGRLEPGKTCVLILTGHGLKDPDSAIAAAEKPVTVEAKEEEILEVLGLYETVNA
jgi:threonine synthase